MLFANIVSYLLWSHFQINHQIRLQKEFAQTFAKSIKNEFHKEIGSFAVKQMGNLARRTISTPEEDELFGEG